MDRQPNHIAKCCVAPLMTCSGEKKWHDRLTLPAESAWTDVSLKLETSVTSDTEVCGGLLKQGKKVF